MGAENSRLLFLENEAVGILPGNRLSVPSEQAQAVWRQDVETAVLPVGIQRDAGFVSIEGEGAAARMALVGTDQLGLQLVGGILEQRQADAHPVAIGGAWTSWVNGLI